MPSGPGIVEGFDRGDILRYLRHEMGHVVNYAYRLYDEEEWVKQFGSITQPYGEDYRPEPFSRRYVRHLPGWYAQKHPDEDWAETFAVWMTPGLDWRAEYGGWPVASAKLAYCDRTMAAPRGPRSAGHRRRARRGRGRDRVLARPVLPATIRGLRGELPPGLDGALRAIFEDLGDGDGHVAGRAARAGRRADSPAGARADGQRLSLDRPLPGAHPRAAALSGRPGRRTWSRAIPRPRETPAIVALTTLVTGLAMNHVQRGSYLP